MSKLAEFQKAKDDMELTEQEWLTIRDALYAYRSHVEKTCPTAESFLLDISGAINRVSARLAEYDAMTRDKMELDRE